MPSYVTRYTGQQIEDAIAKALPLDTFALVEDVVISSTIYHVLWKVAPTDSNQVIGFSISPTTGKLVEIHSNNNVKSVSFFLSSSDSIIETEIDNILSSN